MLTRLTQVFGMTVRGTDDEAGNVYDAYFDDDAWQVRYLVVETGPWFFGKRVLIAPEAVMRVDWDEKVVLTDLTRQQIQDSPDIDLERPVSRQQVSMVNAYYGWPAYWMGGPVAGMTPAGGYPVAIAPMSARPASEQQPEPVAAEERERNPDLRSAREVLGYEVRAQDDDAGVVDDLLLDESWVIRYLVIDTRRILPGKKVLLAPPWTERISWTTRRVEVRTTSETIRSSPEYDPTSPVDRDHERRLREHYGEPRLPAREPEGRRR